jgi:cell wall-associated NlpC family hydrolase
MTPVSNPDMQVGDVLFFSIEGKMSHVGLYLGDGRFVHAPSTGRTVSVASLTSAFYRDALIRAGRPR